MTSTALKSDARPKVQFPSGSCAIDNALLIADIVEATGVSTAVVWTQIEKVCCQGKAYVDNVNSLANLGLPTWQWLCDHNGVDLDALHVMIRAGKVTDQMYIAAIRDNLGGLATLGNDKQLYGDGGLISDNYSVVPIPNNTGRPEYIVPKREGEKAARRLERMLRIVLAPTKADPYFRRGTPHYEEATRVLGASARWTLDESVRQISRRWLKVDRFVPDVDGWPQLTAANDGTLVTESVRIRIPRDSWLARGYSHRRHRKGLPSVG
ncbi:hypothetical protein ATN37_25620 [Rhodococcus sp. MH15]|uniref:hypothetical protein n=1 Tax=Rhodococcus sp. MH15 TaxID=1761014 RepID=UPI001C4E341D|nr:hypothetical protein [Rhodococcus sp. MH15]MBW0294043.1 hypothetical protein [Rhodococcus sp. MH15]